MLRPISTLIALRDVKAACDRRGMELVPGVPGLGWGGQLWMEDPYLIEGVLVQGTALVVRGGRVTPAGNPVVPNGDLESFSAEANTFEGISSDAPGQKSFVDLTVRHSGRASLRLERVGESTTGDRACRAIRRVALKPHHCYRVSAWVKTEDLRSAGRLEIYAFIPGRPGFAVLPFRWIQKPRPTNDWMSVGYMLNSWDQGEVDVAVGLYGAVADDPGKMWLDDFTVEEVGPNVAVRRGATPVVIRRADTGVSLVAEEDYRFPVEPRPSLWDHRYAGPDIAVLPDGPGALKEGDRLVADWYEPVVGPSVHICLSEPRVQALYKEWLSLMDKELQPTTYLLAMDEVRGGGTCALCKGRGMSNGDMLADCVNQVFTTMKQINPKAEMAVFADMFDPSMGAAPGDHFWVPNGFGGSWRNLNRDIIMLCWTDLPVTEEKISVSLKHFSGLGFRVMGGAYYESEDLAGSKLWLDNLARAPKPEGIVYFTTRSDYSQLEGFRDLASGRAR